MSGRWAIAVLVLAVAAVQGSWASARSNPAATACMRLAGAYPHYVLSRQSITVRAGVIVWAIEADNPQPGLTGPGRPNTWPWIPVQSSDIGVLTPVKLCTHNPFTHGNDERVYAFRAQRAGRATLLAALAPSWQRATAPRPLSFRATVAVAP
jgi:hypothetical protein